VRQLKAAIAAEARARSMADSACTLLQAQAQELSNAAAQREVRHTQVRYHHSATIYCIGSLLLVVPLSRRDLLPKRAPCGSVQRPACPQAGALR
jgi:phage terminase Nu1 subunit (DNA packaging protein)